MVHRNQFIGWALFVTKHCVLRRASSLLTVPLNFTMPTNYTRPPPAYGATQPKPGSAEAEPLLGEGSGGIFNQPEEGDLPDDFKYGVTVSESAPEIRHGKSSCRLLRVFGC